MNGIMTKKEKFFLCVCVNEENEGEKITMMGDSVCVSLCTKI